MTHKIDSTGTAAVATDYYWIPIDKDTPHGVKLQLPRRPILDALGTIT